MTHINDLMPHIPGMRWGALLNKPPTNAKIKMIDRLLPHDHKWHLILEDENAVHVDGKTIRRRTLESMT